MFVETLRLRNSETHMGTDPLIPAKPYENEDRRLEDHDKRGISVDYHNLTEVCKSPCKDYYSVGKVR
jgi:hypothetical protein